MHCQAPENTTKKRRFPKGMAYFPANMFWLYRFTYAYVMEQLSAVTLFLPEVAGGYKPRCAVLEKGIETLIYLVLAVT